MIEKITYIRKVFCNVCKTKLLSVYVRDKTTFKSLAGFYFCKNCKKIFKVSEENKQYTI